MVHLLGTRPVTVWEDCQVASSSLMNLMHNAVQEDMVGSLNHLHAILSSSLIGRHSWHLHATFRASTASRPFSMVCPV